jgi:hypothetical protein
MDRTNRLLFAISTQNSQTIDIQRSRISLQKLMTKNNLNSSYLGRADVPAGTSGVKFFRT